MPMTDQDAPAAILPAETGEASPPHEQIAASSDSRPWLKGVTALAPLLLAACGGGGGGEDNAQAEPPVYPAGFDPATGLITVSGLAGGSGNAPAMQPMSRRDAARLLTQGTFGIRTPEEVDAVQKQGVEYWLWGQFNAACVLHTSYLDQQRSRNTDGKAREDMSYEAVWRQWLFEMGQLRARMAFALSQIMVISNVAPQIKPYGMSSYMDMLNRRAFGNFRDLLKEVTLHPAMGYYLDMQGSMKEDPKKGTHPNENFAREVLQLFTIGLVKLNADGSTQVDTLGKPIPTYNESVVKGFARAFSGWAFGGEGNTDTKLFGKERVEVEANWVVPMKPFSTYHETGTKQLLDSKVLPAGQTPEKDLEDAIDNIFNHPNVGPFIGRQLIQRLVTSNPSAAYIGRITAVFNNNGFGVRGDLRAVVRAILTDAEARGDDAPTRPRYGKQREPVIRLANVFRAFGAWTPSAAGRTELHDLDSPEDGLSQSPLLAPSVFNFFSPNYRHAGALAQAGLVAPEFQITTETSVVGCFNTFASVLNWEGYGWGKQSRLFLHFVPWEPLATKPEQLVDRLDLLLCNAQMSATTRARLLTLIKALPSNSWQLRDRIKKAVMVLAVSPDFVIQK